MCVQKLKKYCAVHILDTFRCYYQRDSPNKWGNSTWKSCNVKCLSKTWKFGTILKAGISYQLIQCMISSTFPWEIMPCNNRIKQKTPLINPRFKREKKITHSNCQWAINTSMLLQTAITLQILPVTIPTETVTNAKLRPNIENWLKITTL